jgi:hypothetical protein
MKRATPKWPLLLQEHVLRVNNKLKVSKLKKGQGDPHLQLLLLPRSVPSPIFQLTGKVQVRGKKTKSNALREQKDKIVFYPFKKGIENSL